MFRRSARRATQPPPPQVVSATPAQRAQKIAALQADAATAKKQAAEKEYRDMQLREGVAADKVKPFSAKNASPSPRPMEQVEIDKASAGAAFKESYAPAPNKAPNPEVAGMQKMPNPGLVSQANSMPRASFAPPAMVDMNNQNYQQGGGGIDGGGGFKKGGKIKSKSTAKFSSGGTTSKASSRGDGIAQRGKTKGRMI